MQWVGGTLRPQVAHKYVPLVGGAIGRGRLIWDAYACLYTTDPAYRLFTPEILPPSDREVIRQEVLGLRLPHELTVVDDASAAADHWRAAEPVSRMMHVPMGIYLVGRHFPDPSSSHGRRVSGLWHMLVLSTAQVVVQLKLAAGRATA